MNKQDLFELIQKFNDSNIAELRYSNDDERIVLKKYSAVAQEAIVQTVSNTQPVAQPIGQPVAQDNASHRPLTPTEKPESGSSNTEVITAPIVGTFYRSPSPDSPPFFEEGASVKAGDTICIIEAMKMMNELEADFDMQIEKILVESGTMIEYGTPIFEVKRI